MHNNNLRSIDLNLLTVFHAIYEHGHITKAAEALGLTQPATSHALKRLRDLFQDDLFVRQKRRMDPTHRAHEVAKQVAQILDNVQAIVSDSQEFDPATTQREVRIGMLDYGMTLFATRLATFIEAEAPGLRIDFQHTSTELAIEMLSEGNLELAIGPFRNIGESYQKRVLMRNECVVITRKGHPLGGKKLTLDKFINLDHIQITNLSAIDEDIDAKLKNLGLTRRKLMKLPHYSSALFVVSRNNFAATITRGPAELYREFLGLELRKPPFQVNPLEISIVRHEGSLNDPLNNWLWDRIVTEATR